MALETESSLASNKEIQAAFKNLNNSSIFRAYGKHAVEGEYSNP